MTGEKPGKTDLAYTDIDEINEMILFARDQEGIDVGDISDGYHTFDDLYHQRLILSAALFNTYRGFAWKSRKHSDGEQCFDGGWFIVGIRTPEGQYTYHYEDKWWDIFDVRELDRAPEWDGHDSTDVDRLLSLV